MNSFSPESTTADPNTIEDQVTELYTFAGRIVGRSGEMETVFSSAAAEFSSLVDEGIRDHGSYNRTSWEKASFAVVYAAGVTQGWANDVRWFQETILEGRLKRNQPSD